VPTDDGDPEPPPTRIASALTTLARKAATMPELAPLAARVVVVRLATLRRWIGRMLAGEPLVRGRGGQRAPAPPAAATHIRQCVRELGPLVGAASLARSVVGVSRRAAADLKRAELTAIERERRAACDRVEVLRPGVVRAFDAMHLDDGYGLIAADAAVPFRTSAVRVPAYDALSVGNALADDFATHGAPLIVRLDRARCHDAEPVTSVLAAYRVLPLHGPPHHPQYYGQLERQNREHRAWIAHHAIDSTPPDLTRMRTALNNRVAPA
jgi:hypothetical protein